MAQPCQPRAPLRIEACRNVVTLASLVERETPRPEERPHVAGVFENRLRIGQPLQCDPTVVYALTLAGAYTGKLDGGDLRTSLPRTIRIRIGACRPGRSPIPAKPRFARRSIPRPPTISTSSLIPRADTSSARPWRSIIGTSRGTDICSSNRIHRPAPRPQPPVRRRRNKSRPVRSSP